MYGPSATVLVVDDDDEVRALAVAILHDAGFRAIPATNGDAALTMLQNGLVVDLLFTDIVMPGGVNGRKLADQLRARAPKLKVLFMSGYTENAIVHHGRLDPGVFLLNKPFRKQDLARKIRQVFESEP